MSKLHEGGMERLLDREAIRAVVRQCARGCDRRDWELVREAFHEDARDDHGAFVGGRDEFVDWLRSRHDEGHVEQSMHLLGEIGIDFLAADAAVVETCVRAIQRYSAAAVEARTMFDVGADLGDDARIRVDVAHRYLDRFERRGDRWAIAERVVVYEDVSVTAGAAPAFGQGWRVATRDRDDVLWRMLAGERVVGAD